MLANNVKHKEPERKGLAKQVEQFLEKANKIQVLKPSKKTRSHESF